MPARQAGAIVSEQQSIAEQKGERAISVSLSLAKREDVLLPSSVRVHRVAQ